MALINTTFDYSNSQPIFFRGNRHIVQDVRDFLAKRGNTTEQQQNEMMNKMLEMKIIEVIDETDEFERTMLGLEASIEEQHRVESLIQQDEDYLDYGAEQRKAGKLTHPELTAEFANIKQRDSFKEFVERKLRVTVTSVGFDNETGHPIVVMADVSEREFAKMKNYRRVKGFGRFTANSITATGHGINNTVNFAVNSIVTPVSKSVVGITANLTATVSKAGSDLGGAVVNSTTEEAQRLAKQVREDRDIQVAKQRMTHAKNKVMGFFGGNSGKAGNGFRF